MSSGRRSLNLIILKYQCAVCRLPPTTLVPSWATRPASFVSITRTAEELSIVCPQAWVPQQEVETVECDWVCFKVQGPLDFSWTGILASLANPLGEAGISIFAVSTYDTDYLLVKSDKAEQATQVFRQQGHFVENESESSAKDATKLQSEHKTEMVFESDPFLPQLLDRKNSTIDNLGLVVVAGWPPKREEWMMNYAQFKASMELCFEEADVSADDPAVYLYPFSAIHITIATLRAFTIPSNDLSEEEKSRIIYQWTKVVEIAQRMEEWPLEPLKLQVDMAKLGTRAGILLWKETTGGLEVMRKCLRNAVETQTPEMESAGVSASTFTIPGIVHSTFCRYRKIPLSSPQNVHDRFCETVLPNLRIFFPSTIVVPGALLVHERVPYMHVSNDDEHVLLRCRRRND